MKIKNYYIAVLMLMFSSTSFCQEMGYTANEQNEIKLFQDFKNYIVSGINQNIDFIDSTQLEFVLNHYFFYNFKTGIIPGGEVILNNIPTDKMNYLRKTTSDFYNYFEDTKSKKVAENLTAMPIRKSKDKYLFNRFNSFQKENTLVFFDKRSPNKTLGYMLFIPPIKNVNSQMKIWSWNLGFKFGKFLFTSLTGEEGYEYMFGDNYK